MKTVLALIGFFHAVTFVLGAAHLIDYHVCIDGPGKCQCRSIGEQGSGQS